MQFTCFTGTNVQILTGQKLQDMDEFVKSVKTIVVTNKQVKSTCIPRSNVLALLVQKCNP
jgi:hypothetical protein